MKVESVKLYQQLIKKYGENQLIVAIEELSELQKELCKHLRNNLNIANLIEELADVEIMLEQIKLYFNISPVDVEKKKNWKLTRTKERLLNESRNN